MLGRPLNQTAIGIKDLIIACHLKEHYKCK